MIHQQMIAAFGLESLSNEQLSSYLVIAGWVFTIVQVSMPQNFFFIRYKFCGRRSPSVCPPPTPHCESVQQSQMFVSKKQEEEHTLFRYATRVGPCLNPYTLIRFWL